jgi:hypothetical protein
MIQSRTYPLTILALASLPLLSKAESTQTLPTLYVDGQQTANIRPVTTYESPVSNLEFEPRVDLQSRNMAEAQGDVTIRGGIFENTGFRVGSATLIDPQTGHYFAELPIAPEMLTRPDILIGADNALYGFNSTVGTISYGWSQIADVGSLTVGGGDHDLNFQRIHHGLTGQLGESGEWSWGVEAEISRSESDGTIQFSDHDFDRSSGRVQLVGPNSQTDFFAGYQAKFFGWPNMYTPYGVNETENLKTSLFLFNHYQNYSERSYFEITAYYREHKDHYIYSRENPSVFQAKHTTDVSTFAFSGLHALGEAFSLNYSGQITADEIESTSLERGKFESRTYSKLSLLPEYKIELAPNEHLVIQIGGSFDDTNRNDSEFSLISNIAWGRQHYNGNSESVYLSYSETSQVVGYTAIGGSETTGLFRSNHDLGREKTQNVEIGTKVMRQDWSIEAAVFYRWDDNLVDWTFAGTSAREANPVDIETFGFELIASKRWDSIETIASYTFLDKDEDYGNDTIDASFYALNYANHRFTLGATWRPCEILEVRIDNEWRENEDNALRNSSDFALFTHFGLSIYPTQVEGLEIFFAIDNAWNDDFEDVPGTPGRGDQYSTGVTLSW